MSETHWKQNFDYKYTGAYELKPGETKTLTIKSIQREEVQATTGEKQVLPVIYTVGNGKPMVLNKTNCKTLEKLFGTPFLEQWVGKTFIVESKKVKAWGEWVEALRVKNCITISVTPEEIQSAIKTICECKTLDELKKVYLALSKEIQAATAKTKDEIKTRLGGAK